MSGDIERRANVTRSGESRRAVFFSAWMFCVALIVNFGTIAAAQDGPLAPAVTLGLDQRLGETVDMSLEFRDETGQPVTLAQIARGKPIMLMLVYYRCPGICSPLMSGVGEAAARLSPGPGESFTLVSISFSPEEGPELAAAKKQNYLAASNGRIPPEGWRFLTGSAENIAAIARQVGFNYMKAPVQNNEWTDFVHTGVVTVLSPTGRISRYLLPSGTTMTGLPDFSFLPMDFKIAALEAAEGRTGPVVAKAVQFCFSYDPQGRKYTFNILRVAGLVCLLGLSGFAVFLFVTTRSFRRRQGLEPPDRPDHSMPHEVTHHG
ncbi:MAG: hypothetical protein Kow0059_20190 [Candidatus Sumerlaeia bacterium]